MSEDKAEYKIPGRPSTIFRVVHDKDNPYVIINRILVDNPVLSFKAKGILTYLLSRPDGWEVSVADLINHSTDGRASIRSGLKELRAAGHMHYSQARKSGRITGWVIEVYEVPIMKMVGDTDEIKAEDSSVACEKVLDEELSPECDFQLVENQQVENQQVENHTQVVSNCISKETETNIAGDIKLKDYKKRLAISTAQGIINSGKSRSNGANNWPADLTEWGETWRRLWGRDLLKGEFGLAITDMRQLAKAGFTPTDMETAFHAAVFFEETSCTHPAGCKYVLDEMRQGIRNPDGTRKNKKAKPRRQVVSAEA